MKNQKLIIEAIKKNDFDAVETLLVKEGYDSILEALDKNDATPLGAAVINNNVSMVTFIANKIRLHASETPTLTSILNKGSLLHKAISRNATDSVRYLLEQGVEVNTPLQMPGSTLGDTPLHIAAIVNQPKIIDLLIQHGANLDAYNSHNKRPHEVIPEDRSDNIILKKINWLNKAVKEGDLKTVQEILPPGSVNVHLINFKFSNEEWSPLRIAAYKNQDKILEYLLTELALRDPETNIATHIKNNKLLFYAIGGNALETVQFLLKNGADVTQVEKANPAGLGDSATPLHMAAYINNPKIIDFLLEHNSNINAVSNNMRPYEIKTKDGSPNYLSTQLLLLSKAIKENDIKEIDRISRPPLGHPRLLTVPLDKSQQSTLHLATELNQDATIKHITSILEQSKIGTTEILSKRDSFNMTPLDYLEFHKNETMHRFLEERPIIIELQKLYQEAERWISEPTTKNSHNALAELKKIADGHLKNHPTSRAVLKLKDAASQLATLLPATQIGRLADISVEANRTNDDLNITKLPTQFEQNVEKFKFDYLLSSIKRMPSALIYLDKSEIRELLTQPQQVLDLISANTQAADFLLKDERIIELMGNNEEAIAKLMTLLSTTHLPKFEPQIFKMIMQPRTSLDPLSTSTIVQQSQASLDSHTPSTLAQHPLSSPKPSTRSKMVPQPLTFFERATNSVINFFSKLLIKVGLRKELEIPKENKDSELELDEAQNAEPKKLEDTNNDEPAQKEVQNAEFEKPKGNKNTELEQDEAEQRIEPEQKTITEFIQKHFNDESTASLLIKGYVANKILFNLPLDQELAIQNYQGVQNTPSANKEDEVRKMMALYQEANIWISKKNIEESDRTLDKLIAISDTYLKQYPNDEGVKKLQEDSLKLKTLLPLKFSSVGNKAEVSASPTTRTNQPVKIESLNRFTFWKEGVEEEVKENSNLVDEQESHENQVTKKNN